MTNPKHYSLFDAEMEVLRLLYEKKFRNSGDIVEIGAYKGQRTVQFSNWIDWGKVIVIDPWDGKQDGAGQPIYDEFCRNTAGLTNLTVIRQRSQTVTLEHVRFVFHDGDHEHPDFQRWYDMLLPEGILVVHDIFDIGWPNVRKAADLLPLPRHEYRYIPTPEEVETTYSPSGRGLAWWIHP